MSNAARRDAPPGMTPLPATIHANEGISQALFFQSDEPCEVSYADRKGKYQRQQGLTLPRL